MRFRWPPFVLLFLALHIFANAQPQIAFERYYDFGVGNAEEGTCVQQTSDGGYIITGRQTVNLQTMYILLQKTDSLGNVQWMKQLGSQYWNKAYAVRQTYDGGYVLTGFTDDASGTDFICLVKTDSVGDTLWARNYAPLAMYNYRKATDVIQTSDSGYLVLATYVDVSDTLWQGMLIKTDSVGNILWTKKYLYSNGNTPCCIKPTNDGGYIIVSYTGPSSNDNSFYLIKIDSIGDTMWTKTIQHPIDYYYGMRPTNCIQKTSDGGYFLIGTIIDSNSGNDDIIAIKTDVLGDTLWTRVLGGSGEDWGWGGGLQTTDGGYIVAGITTSFGNGGLDVYLIKMNMNGSLAWTRTFGGWNDEYANYVIPTFDGGYAICGQSTSWGDGINLYLIKTDSLGNAPTGLFSVFTSGDQTDIYPNPFSDFTTIHLADATKFPCDFILYDFSGREVRQDKIISYENSLERNNLSTGIYLCSIIDSEGKILCNKKIIVQ